ncbi:unnamed protein product [Danaus chrysippus]|uniref:(African queen) hypothetical protein n=1 Tax=Danaus chrysippus TaxID=151541 RepID=A0A8J2W8Z8_9NEOP|nr:unnamed protein product [Danaus chrysippus]
MFVVGRELTTDMSLNLQLEESTVRSERMTPLKFSTAHVKVFTRWMFRGNYHTSGWSLTLLRPSSVLGGGALAGRVSRPGAPRAAAAADGADPRPAAGPHGRIPRTARQR